MNQSESNARPDSIGASWEDLPARVVGRRKPGVINLESMSGFLEMVRVLSKPVQLPRGVFRFRSFAEADEWMLRNTKTR